MHNELVNISPHEPSDDCAEMAQRDDEPSTITRETKLRRHSSSQTTRLLPLTKPKARIREQNHGDGIDLRGNAASDMPSILTSFPEQDGVRSRQRAYSRFGSKAGSSPRGICGGANLVAEK